MSPKLQNEIDEDDEKPKSKESKSISPNRIFKNKNVADHENNGFPLDVTTRRYMESHLGHDFSDVKIHTDKNAVDSANSVKAYAYTAGNNIIFGKGQFKPNTNEGKKLLAHELTHVVQQERNHPPFNAEKNFPGFRVKSDRILGNMESDINTHRYEIEANRAAKVVSEGGTFNIQERNFTKCIQLSPLTDELGSTLKANGKGKVFDILRARGPISDVDLISWINSAFVQIRMIVGLLISELLTVQSRIGLMRYYRREKIVQRQTVGHQNPEISKGYSKLGLDEFR